MCSFSFSQTSSRAQQEGCNIHMYIYVKKVVIYIQEGCNIYMYIYVKCIDVSGHGIK